MSQSTLSGAAPSPRGPWFSFGVVAVALFLSVLSMSIVAVALPAIGRALGATPTDLQWIVDAYVLVYASLLIAGGVVGDRRGRKGVFMLGIVAFGTGTLIGGLAPNITTLLIGRGIQGLGPALIIPGSLTIITATFADYRQHSAALGLWSTSSGIALAIGPVLGGAVVDAFGWRWVFLFNAPCCLVLLWCAARFVPRIPHVETDSRFDWLGLILSTFGIGAVTFAIINGQDRGWLAPPIVAAFVAGIVALIAFVPWELRRREPLVDVRLFQQPAFTIANVAALVVFFAFVGAIVYFSAYFLQVQGRTAVQTGIDVSAIGVAYAFGAALSGRLVGRFGPRLPMLCGLALSGIGMLALLRLRTDTGIGAIWWDFALVGGAVGASLTPMVSIAMAAVDKSRTGMASAVHNAMRQLGQVLGVAVLGALIYAGLPRGSGVGVLTPAQAALFVAGLHHALWLAGLALLAATALAVVMLRRA
jgi:MFS transporter, DHA2 family, methylenomycin A resistance protein